MTRPPKLAPSATLVIWGARRLTLGEKVVWYHDWTLDHGADGCFASHAAIAARVGGSLTEATVSKIRQRLKRLALHDTIQRPGARNLGWVSTLPRTCVPTSFRDIPALAVVLDRLLGEQSAWRDGRPSGLDTIYATVQSEETPGSNDAEGVGGRGEDVSLSEEGEAQLPTRLRGEKGVRARAPKGREGKQRLYDDRPLDTDERKRLDEMLTKYPPEQAARLRRIAGL